LRKGEVRVNKGRVKAEYKLSIGDIIRIPPIRVADERDNSHLAQLAQVKDLEKCIIHETKQYLVINKPSGIAVHGGSGLSFGVIEGLRALRPKEKFLELVHRIDKDTSGCLLIAKRRSYLIHFQNQLRHRKMNKQYIAIVSGRWPKGKKLVDEPLLKTNLPSGERVVLVDKEGKPSQTRFELVESFDDYSLIRAKPLTGRTHQIRVHARHCFCPLLGDEKYSDLGKDSALIEALKIKTFFLHAESLSFTLPNTVPSNSVPPNSTLPNSVQPNSEKWMNINAPIPVTMLSIIDSLR